MNNIDLMMKMDSGKLTVAPTRDITVTVGDEEMTWKIKALAGKRFQELSGKAVDDDGNVDMERAYGANLLLCSEGVVDPDLKDKELMAHFGAATPADLLDKLFKYNGGEIGRIADAIVDLSGYGKDTKKKVKN